MAITIEIEDSSSISLEDYIEYVAGWVDEDDDDSLLASAPKLRALANNRKLLNDTMNRYLSVFDPVAAFAVKRELQDTSFTLAEAGNLRVRANVWVPPAELPVSRKWQANRFTYLKPHDHNFSFLTAGYLGAGYATHIYEYDRSSITGIVGEPVDLRFCERTTLPTGKIMLYRAFKDIHFQEHPTEFSISVNLVAMRRVKEDQYIFDLDHGTIALRTQDFRMGQSLVCRMAAVVGDERTVSLLEQNALRNPYPEVRLSAFEALSSVESSNARKVWEPALHDPDETVRATASVRLALC